MPSRFMLPILSAALVSWSALAAPQEAPASDFEYKIKDGKATLTKYKGDASELVIPEKIDNTPVTKLGNESFRKNAALVRVTIPDTVTAVDNQAFSSCANLESVKMSKNITFIDYACFAACRKLKEIAIPKGLYLGDVVFCGCDSLDTLITGDGTHLIRIGADVREYTVPSSIRFIQISAFQDSQIERVVFEEGPFKAARYAFKGCKNLTSVTFPKTLKEIEKEGLAYCPSLTNVIFMGDCPRNSDDLFKDSPDVTVYYNPSAKGWKPDSDGKWAAHGVPLRPLDKSKGGQNARPLKSLTAQQEAPKPAAAPAPAVAEAAPAPTAAAPKPPENTMPAAEFDALYAEKSPLFPPALQKLHGIFTNETTKIDLDRVRGHAAALGDYAANLDKLPSLFAKKADVEGVKAAKAAKELVYRGEVDTSGARPEIAALTATYAKRCAVSDAKAADALAALVGKYINVLNANVRDLLEKNDIQTAELYKLEADAADRVRYAAQTGEKSGVGN